MAIVCAFREEGDKGYLSARCKDFRSVNNVSTTELTQISGLHGIKPLLLSYNMYVNYCTGYVEA